MSAIGSAVQDGNYVKVYDENGGYKFEKSGELVGYTSSTVTVKDGNYAKTYDSDGGYKFEKYSG